MPTRYFESFETEETYSLGSRTVSEEEIIEFAEQYDPQAFHLDSAVAAESMFGARIASGWHTASLCMRQLVDELFVETAVVGALGVDELRWLKPVYGGDELQVSTTVAETKPWDDTKGLVEFELTAENGDGEPVHTRRDLVLIEREP